MFGIGEVLLFSLSFAVAPASSRDIDYCYANNVQPYLKFGTKTAYEFVHGGRIRYQTIPDCDPVQIWMLIKYGTRYPGKDTIPQMLTLPRLREQIVYNHQVRGFGRLCDNDLENFKNWAPPGLSLDTAESLTEEGAESLKLLARRTKSNFPELFPPIITDTSSRNYVFRSGDGDPTTASTRAFASGLFGDSQGNIQPLQDSANDTLFEINRGCPTWEKEVGNNPESLKEAISFAEGPEYQNLILNVSRRLGFLYNLTTASVNIMYDMCRYDKAWKVSEVSPWCAAFSDEDLKILEYREDLIEYYKRGYGHELNRRMGCPLMQDMFRSFQKLEGNEYSNEPKGIFSVISSSDLESFLTAMGFAKDTLTLLANNYQSMNKRNWRTSEIASFTGNIQAVFYKCHKDRSPNKVVFYLAEKPVSYEGCRVGLCEWDYLKDKFGKVVSDCNLNFCYPNGAVTHLFSPAATIPLALFVLASLTATGHW